MAQPPPLAGIRVLEIAGLAPGPFAGLLLADYGATVLRVDRAIQTRPTEPTPDQLTRRKCSICIDLKDPLGIDLLLKLLPSVDVLIDPFRPGVLEKLGLCPKTVLLRHNPRLIVARLTGFRRDGKYAAMAGHDINYIAVSGVLSLFGRAGEAPYAPGNLVGDFAGGGAMAFLGILLALLTRQRDGRGQVVEANMVDGSAALATMPRLALKTDVWGHERGTNLLDGGAPWYGTYETQDGRWMAVGAIEPQFWALLLKGLGLAAEEVPDRGDRRNWPALREALGKAFKSKTRKYWEEVFDGTDACCTPVLEHRELEAAGFEQRPAVTLTGTPGLAVAPGDAGREASMGQGSGVEGSGWSDEGLVPGTGGEELLAQWVGWRRGKGYDVKDGGLVSVEVSKL